MDIAQVRRLSDNAKIMREERSRIQYEFKEENTLGSYSRNQLIQLLSLAKKVISETKLKNEMEELEEELGYQFPRRGKGKTSPHKLSHEDLFKIASKLEVQPHHSKGMKAFVSIMMNLKGGVGKSLATNMAATAAIMLDKYLLQQLRVLIIDLDPQATSTETNIPDLKFMDTDMTSIQAMADDLTREELLKYAVKKTAIPNLSIIPCGTFDGFITEQLALEENRGGYTAAELLQKRIIEPLEYDFDIILLDCGPHMDIVMKNALHAAHGVFVPVPPTFYNYHSTMCFLEKLHETILQMMNDGYELSNLQFIKGFITKDASHINTKNSKHKTMLISTLDDDIQDVFGRNDVLSHPLRQEEVYERCVELGGTIFTLQKSKYDGAPEPFNRAYSQAKEWAIDVISEILAYQKEI